MVAIMLEMVWMKKVKKYLEEATEVYIDRVQESSCCWSPVLVMKGAVVNLHKDDVALNDVKDERKMTQCACVHMKLNYLCHVASHQRHYRIAVFKLLQQFKMAEGQAP